MSKTINARATTRWKLLASVSAAALIASAFNAGEAQAANDDTDQPQLWIELGAQLERASGGDSAFAPPFYSHVQSPIDSPATITGELPWSLGPDGKISFRPDDSDWIFSAGIRYGRAKSHRSTHQLSHPAQHTNVAKYLLQHYYSPGGQYYYYKIKCCHHYVVSPNADYADIQSNHQESHLVLDFQAGKDVGLGLFGGGSTSAISAGVRFAQFSTRSDVAVKARTDLHSYNGFDTPNYASSISRYPSKYNLATRHREFSLTAGSARSFRGIGPAISWEASATLAGAPDSSELTFDWGINASLLFGKQKAKTHHQSSGHYHRYKYGNSSYYNHPRVDFSRSRNVTVPNAGGMAGFSIKFPNAKVSIGYRADIFFGAMDDGWDTRKSQNRSFNGPFASISVGLP